MKDTYVKPEINAEQIELGALATGSGCEEPSPYWAASQLWFTCCEG
jgi:hypothetical protein